MTLMKLAPEIVRLRRVAKAYAAGEFSQHEYRTARREVIENFRPDVLGDDDTQRRAPGQAPAHRQPRVRRRSSPSLWFFGALVLGVLLFGLATQALGAVRIGEVRERDPNPDASPRIVVSALTIRDFHAYPGIDRLEAQRVLDDGLRAVAARNAPGEHGFTVDELDEVGRFLNALGAHSGQTPLTQADAAHLQELVAEQKSRRGVSVVELEEVARALQTHYRDAGYLLAVAYVPSQEVANGVVELAVLPGVLGEVTATPGQESLVASRFDSALGQPVTEDLVARRLYLLNTLPGLQAQAAFQPGTRVGETRLNVDVVQDGPVSGSVGLDNHGDSVTGRERLGLYGSWLNPRGAGDVLNGGLMQTLNPANQTYAFLEYRTPLGGLHEISARLANNAFTADAGPQIDGDGVLADLSVSRSIAHSRARSVSASLGLHRHHFGWQDTPDQSASFVSTSLDARRVFDQIRVAGGIRLRADAGKVSSGAFVGQRASFWRLGLSVDGWKPLQVPMIAREAKLALRLQGQLSGSQLPSTLRMALGGAGRARGYDRNVFLADGGVALGVDLRFPVARGELVWFTDAAYGETLNSANDAWGYLWSAGIGWDAQLTQRLVSRLSLAVPLHTDGSSEIDNDSAKFFWSLRYAY